MIFKPSKCPEPLCTLKVLPIAPGYLVPRQRALPHLHRSYELMRQTKSLPSISVFPIRSVFAGCRHSLLGVGPSRRYLRESFSTCMDPYPGCSCGACTRFFPQNIGLPGDTTRSALGNTHAMATSACKVFSELQSFDHLHARRFARHPGRSHRNTSRHQAAVAFTSPHISVRCLPEQGIC